MLWISKNSWVAHPWWITGSLKSFLGCQNYFDLSLKDICVLVTSRKFPCFPFNLFPTYGQLGRPSGSCWIAQPRNGSHLATGRPLIHSLAQWHQQGVGTYLLDHEQPLMVEWPVDHDIWHLLANTIMKYSICSEIRSVVAELTHCGLETPYGGRNLGQHWFR